jgi:hypothetical protein
MEVMNMKGAKAFLLQLWRWIRTAVPRSVTITDLARPRGKGQGGSVW